MLVVDCLAAAGLFGNNQQQQQQQQISNPRQTLSVLGTVWEAGPPSEQPFWRFGQQNTANTAQPQQNSLFGSTLGQSTNQQSTLGAGSLFGKPAVPAMGASTSNTNAPAGGLFGLRSRTLTASIAEPIGNNLAIFSMLPPGPRSINLDPQPAKKKAGFFVDVPTRAPLPRVQLGYTPAASKLRGFASSTSNSTSGNPFSSVSFISGKAGALSLSRGDSKSPISSDSLLRNQSPSLGSSQRQSVKKLILDKKVEPIDLFSKSGGRQLGWADQSPALSVAAREKEAAAAAPSPQKTVALPALRDQRTPSRLDTNNPQARNASPVTEAQKDPTALEEGDYWCKPDLDTLKGKGFQELSSFSGLALGRKGYGEIHFLEPVDLTGLPKLGSLLGDVVRFDDKECSVYPDVDDVDKPLQDPG
ncbi:nucleoporin autopeptidase-domain-containing protein [Salix suchowensis]|nr:nucleoporin autopeptidase-domain-containing protein [Salix suchowensis]